MGMRRRERYLYRYRPDSMADQHQDSQRLEALREEELRGISDGWEGAMRENLGSWTTRDPGVRPTRTARHTGHTRHRRGPAWRDRLVLFFGGRRSRGSAPNGRSSEPSEPEA